MIEVSSVLFMGLWELVLLLLAVDVIIIVRFIIRRRREKTSIERLVTIVRRDAERREKETRNLLEKKYSYSDEQLEKAAKKIIREEKRIYQTLANLFTTRDSVAIENLSIAFEEAVEPYRALEVPKLIETNDADGGGGDGSTEIRRLKELNQALNEELRVTMNTLSRMLHEYSTMLSETGVDKADPDAVAALIAGDQESEDTSSVTAGDVAEENVPDQTTEAAAPAETAPQEIEEVVTDVPNEVDTADGKNLESEALVGMFQEDDDDILAEDDTSADPEEETFNNPPEPESTSTEDLLAQEIEGVLDNQDTDLPDIKLNELDIKSAEAVSDSAEESQVAEPEIDPTEELLAQAIGETLEGHKTPLPDLEEIVAEEAESEIDPTEELLAQAIGETLEGHETPLPDLEEVVTEEAESEIDPTEELLAQAIGETLEGHETPLPDLEEAVVEDADPAEEPLAPDAIEKNLPDKHDAEKKLTDEIEETLNSPSESMSEEDIDSLLSVTIDTK